MASVTVDRLSNGAHKVRWREWVTKDGKRTRRARSRTVSTRAAAIELQAEVLRALEVYGHWVEQAPEVGPVGDLEEAGAAWLRHKASRCSAGTVRKYGTALTRFYAGVRQAKALTGERRVPVSVLSTDLLVELTLAWQREGLSESSVYTLTRVAYDVWNWAADEPGTYPGTPAAPRVMSKVLSQAPTYAAPPAPTLEEVDACIRHLGGTAYVARGAALVMRYTGLRASQALGIEVRDVDLEAGTLRVRHGKTRRERAEQRVMPMSPHLVELARVWVEERDEPTDLLIRRRRDLRAPHGRQHLPTKALRAAWEQATAAGEARRDVWDPPNRKLARPEHAFRAAFQAHLEAQGVREAVIDFLVGHAPRSVRGRHYSPPTEAELRSAVQRLGALRGGCATRVTFRR